MYCRTFWYLKWNYVQRGEKKGWFPFCFQISASFSREVSCRRGGSAGHEEPWFSRMKHPVCFSQSAPTQSPPQYITATQWVFSHQWGQIGVSNMRVCIVGVVEDLLTQGPSTNPRVDDDIFPFVCDIQRRLLYKKSSSSAWCRDTRSPWVEIRQKGILCYAERDTHTHATKSVRNNTD